MLGRVGLRNGKTPPWDEYWYDLWLQSLRKREKGKAADNRKDPIEGISKPENRRPKTNRRDGRETKPY